MGCPMSPIPPWREWAFIVFIGGSLGLLGWMLGSMMLATR